jgi:hypothetical protein
VDNNKQTIREQLMAGGIRLAKLLNQIFGWIVAWLVLLYQK